MNKATFDFKKVRQSIFKRMGKKSRKNISDIPGVYDELPPAKPITADTSNTHDDDTYLRPQKMLSVQQKLGAPTFSLNGKNCYFSLSIPPELVVESFFD